MFGIEEIKDKIDGMSINEYANVQNEFAISNANEMQEFIEALSDEDASRLLRQINKGMFDCS